MTRPNMRQRDGDSVHQARRAIAYLPALLAAFVGMVNAIGFLAFGDVFLASPDTGATILGVNLPGQSAIAYFAGAMIVSFIAGVTAVTLISGRASRLRRTLVLSVSSLILLGAFASLRVDLPLASAVLMAMAMGGIHCVFERDPASYQEAMSPSAQVVRLGEALAGAAGGRNGCRVALHASYWLAFAVGGVAGAAGWLGLNTSALLAAAGIGGMLALGTRLFERDLAAS